MNILLVYSQFYNAENITAFRPTFQSDCHYYHPIYAYDVERMLSNVSKTAPGPVFQITYRIGFSSFVHMN
jgi:hypothetical protein